jgi:hypothetical protein
MAEVTLAPTVASPPTAPATDAVPWTIGLGWAALTALGFTAAGALTNGAVLGVRGGLLATNGAVLGVRGGLLATPGLVVLGLALVATLQWVVLRRALPGTSWPRWVAATLGGQLAGTLAVGVVVMAPLALGLLGGPAGALGAGGLSVAARMITGAVLGAVIGAAQWTVLRRRVADAHWWIAAVALANAAAAFVPAVDAGAAGLVVPFLVGRALYGAVLGAVTGGALAWLVRGRANAP